MNLNIILIGIVSISCLSLMLRSARSQYHRGWIFVCSSILAILGATGVLVPHLAGYVGGGLWLTFVLAPLIGLRGVNQCIYRDRYRLARQLAAGLSWLHPFDGWRRQVQLLRAMELAQGGDSDRARELVQTYQGSRPEAVGYGAIAVLYRMEARWDDLLGWMRDRVPDLMRRESPVLTLHYLRALGETGHLQGLLSEYLRCELTLGRLGTRIQLNLARAVVLAFCGETEAVRLAFDESLDVYPRTVRDFWLATATIAAGNLDLGRRRLHALHVRADRPLQNAIAWRLARPLPTADTLDARDAEAIALLKGAIAQEARYGSVLSFRIQHAPATLALVVANLIVFGVEIQRGGSQDLNVLFELGALNPEAVVAGEWWRAIAANFLHHGPLHLTTNLLGLGLLGPYVERTLGIWRFLVGYFVSGVGTMLAYTGIAIAQGAENNLLVGASAAIMGLVGVTAAILLQGWRKERSPLAKKRLSLILWIIGLQVAFDLAVPRVSFLGHTTGLVLGFLVGSIFLPRMPKRKRS